MNVFPLCLTKRNRVINHVFPPNTAPIGEINSKLYEYTGPDYTLIPG